MDASIMGNLPYTQSEFGMGHSFTYIIQTILWKCIQENLHHLEIVKNVSPATKSIINNEKANQFHLIKIKDNIKITRKQAVERNICIQTTWRSCIYTKHLKLLSENIQLEN